MPKLNMMQWWPILLLTISGCAGTGKGVLPPPICPQPLSPPPELMQAPSFEREVRLILFDSAPNATPASAPGKPSTRANEESPDAGRP